MSYVDTSDGLPGAVFPVSQVQPGHHSEVVIVRDPGPLLPLVIVADVPLGLDPPAAARLTSSVRLCGDVASTLCQLAPVFLAGQIPLERLEPGTVLVIFF